MSYWSLLFIFLRLGLTSFGGPVAHIGYFHNEFVSRRRWLSDNEFAALLSVCQIIPGPASSQLGFVIGYWRAGWIGAILAFIGFTFPSVALLLAFAVSLESFHSAYLDSLLVGLKLVAVAIVADALVTMWRALCRNHDTKLIALLSAGVVLWASLPFIHIAIIATCGLVGAFICRAEQPTKITHLALGKSVAISLLLSFFGLLIFASAMSSAGQTDAGLLAMFYQTGALVFGGGHVVLPLLEQGLVATQWLSATTFLSGYGAAQGIPGPMFSVAAFYGFSVEAAMPPLLMAVLALLLIFLPGFLLLMGILPFWAQLHTLPRVKNGLTAINAAVVGFLLAAWWDPVVTSAITHVTHGVIALIAFGLLRGFKINALWIVLSTIAVSMLLT